MTSAPLAAIHPSQEAWHEADSTPSLPPALTLQQKHLCVAGGEREGQEVSAFAIWLFSLDKCLPLVFSRLAPSSSISSAYRPTDSPVLRSAQAAAVSTSQRLQENSQRGCSSTEHPGEGRSACAGTDLRAPFPPISLQYPFFFKTNSGNVWPCQHEIPYPAQGFMPLLSLQSPRISKWKRILCDNNPQFGTTLGLARLCALK